MVSGHVLTSLCGQYIFKTRLCLIPPSPSLIITCHSPLYPCNKEERAPKWLQFTVPFVIALFKVIGLYPLGCYLVSLMFKFTIIKTCPAGFSCTRLTRSALGEWIYVLSCGWRPDPAWSLTSQYMSARVFLQISVEVDLWSKRNAFISCNESKPERPKSDK